MLLQIYLFFLIYAPKIAEVYDLLSLISIIITAHCLLIGAVAPMEVKNLRSNVVLLFSVLLIYSLLLVYLEHSPDFYQVLRFIRVIINFLGAYSLVKLYYLKYRDKMGDKILEHLFWAIFVHAVIMLAMFISEPIRSFVYNTLQISYERILYSTRTSGLTTSLDALSGLQGFGVIIFPFVMHYYKGYKTLFFSTAVVIVFISVIISGRTGMVLIALFLPMTLFLIKKIMLRKLISFGLALIFLFLLVSVVSLDQEIVHNFNISFDRSKDFFGLGEEAGGVKSDASQKLINDYINGWPDDPLLFLSGNSTSGRTSWYFILRDPGYILDIYGVGLTGSFLIVSFYFICILHALRCKRYHFYVGISALIFAVQTLIIHAKVHYLLARNSFTVTALFLVLTVYIQRDNVRCLNIIKSPKDA